MYSKMDPFSSGYTTGDVTDFQVHVIRKKTKQNNS